MTELKTVKDRVQWIYSNYKDAINYDHILLIIYEHYFSKTKFSEATIKRAGRFWRNTKIYKRDERVLKRNREQIKEFKKEFGR